MMGTRLCSMAQLSIVSNPRARIRIESARTAFRTKLCNGGTRSLPAPWISVTAQPTAIASSASRTGSRHERQPYVRLGCCIGNAAIDRVTSVMVAWLLGYWVARLLGCWVAGLLGCWVTGLLGCWVTGLLGCWIPGFVGYETSISLIPNNQATQQPSNSAT